MAVGLDGAVGPAAVLFDMDGTLVDSEAQWLRAEIHVMRQLGGEWTAIDQEHCLGKSIDHAVEYMIGLVGGGHSFDEVHAMLMDEIRRLMSTEAITWQPGARDLLLELRESGVPTGLVSTTWFDLVSIIRTKIEADLGVPAFDAVVAGDHVRDLKPHPAPYLMAAELLGVAPADCLVVEDSPVGARSGVAAGCRVIAVPHVAAIDEPGAVIVRSLEGQTVDDLWQATSA